MLSKIDKDSKQAIAGVTFNVNDIVTNPTENNGITYVNGEDGNPLEVNIDKNNVDEVDTYEIKEINTNDEYYKINGSLTVNVTKKKIIFMESFHGIDNKNIILLMGRVFLLCTEVCLLMVY